jgi:hypothetical protein
MARLALHRLFGAAMLCILAAASAAAAVGSPALMGTVEQGALARLAQAQPQNYVPTAPSVQVAPQPPAPGYGAPQPGYGGPQPGYGAPAPGYGGYGGAPGGLVPPAVAARAARASVQDGKLLDVQLSLGARPVYLVKIANQGQVRIIVIDARTGHVIGN